MANQQWIWHLVLSITVAATGAARGAPPPASAAEPIEIVPGRSLGPIRIGMKLADVEKLGLTMTKPSSEPADQGVWKIGSFQVTFDAHDIVQQIEVDSIVVDRGFRSATLQIPPGSTAAAIAKTLGCEMIPQHPPLAEGESPVYQCEDVVGTTRITSAGDPNPPAPQKPRVWVKVLRTRTCEAELGKKTAAALMDQCRMVSPATHPPCSVMNPCSMIRKEIARGCEMLKSDPKVARICAPSK